MGDEKSNVPPLRPQPRPVMTSPRPQPRPMLTSLRPQPRPAGLLRPKPRPADLSPGCHTCQHPSRMLGDMKMGAVDITVPHGHSPSEMDIAGMKAAEDSMLADPSLDGVDITVRQEGSRYVSEGVMVRSDIGQAAELLRNESHVLPEGSVMPDFYDTPAAPVLLRSSSRSTP